MRKNWVVATIVIVIAVLTAFWLWPTPTQVVAAPKPATVSKPAVEEPREEAVAARRPEAPDEPEVADEDLATISGRVVDGAGKPVADVEVRANLRVAGRSDATGAFTATKVQKGRQVFLTAHEPRGGTIGNTVAEPGATNVVLQVTPFWKIRGRVVGSNRDGRPDATVNSTRVDEHGRFEVTQEPGPVIKLFVSAKGFAMSLREFSSTGGDTDVGDIELKGREIRLRVIDAFTSQPVENAIVFQTRGSTAGSIPIGATNAIGVLAIGGLQEADLALTIDHATHVRTSVVFEDGEVDKTVKLAVGASLEVKVLDEAGWPQETTLRAIETTTSETRLMRSNTNGWARDARFPPGEWTVFARHDGSPARAQQTVRVPEGGSASAELWLKNEVTVAVTLSPGLAKTATGFCLLPPRVAPPASLAQLSNLSDVCIRPKGNEVEGLAAGRYVAMVTQKGKGKSLMFIPLDVTIAPHQTFTLAEGSWGEALK